MLKRSPRLILSSFLVLGACSAPAAPEPGEPGPPPEARELLLVEELDALAIRSLEPGSDTQTTALEVASQGFVYEVDVEDETGRIALSYSPPPTDSPVPFDRSAIFVLETDGTLERLTCEDAPGVWCTYPTWAPDGRVWYARAVFGTGPELVLEDVSSGQIDVTIPDATEPALSPDGSLIAWVGVDAETEARHLGLSNSDGTPVRVLVPEDTHQDIGLPFFSPDGEYVYYVALRYPWDYIDAVVSLFVSTAYAHQTHELPADVWRVPVAGGDPEQVTDSGTIHYDGLVDPGGKWLWLATREGVLRVHLASGEVVTELASEGVRALDVR